MPRTTVRPADRLEGVRVMWVDPPGTMHMVHDGRTRGWRAGSDPTQARAIPGSQHSDPHAWFVLLVEEEAWFAHKHAGRPLDAGCAIWVPIDRVVTD